MRRFPVLHLCVLLVFNTAISHAADCNSNGIEDACDVSCSNPGCSGVQGCGETPDCNGNGVPDECDIGGLYLGTQGGTADVGRVYVYNGGTNWADITPDPPWNVAAVMDLAFYNGKLYAGVQTEHFPTVGGSVGEVWRYDGNKLWTRVKTGLGNSAVALEVYKDETGAPALFVATNTMAIKYCSVCDGTPADWVDVAQGSGTGFRSGYVTSAALCGEPELFLGELNTDDFWRFTWNTGLVEIDTQSGSCIWDFAEYDSDYDTGHLYAGAWAGNGGPVYRTEPDFLCDQL